MFRLEFPPLVAGLVRLTCEAGRAEVLVLGALAVALKRWPDLACSPDPS
ncbi:hypothetical protein [Nannocystis radixulma]|uniref:Uncharacterized protein n=1 Tax=Nannocystis radixulma TaxID=2995305 RepID=A0ABT5B2P8_9BACT|nr:hypothetical protein [Nannocystis radixulma]MDC0668371.1 hypothetical protein [Nannocystis radixulma]